jgi:hypothetical protein
MRARAPEAGLKAALPMARVTNLTTQGSDDDVYAESVLTGSILVARRAGR